MDPVSRALGFNVSRESQARLEVFVTLLKEWQNRINLIGPSTVNQIWERHIVDSLQLLPLLPSTARVIADLGSGAGFPGFILALVGDFTVHLYETNSKKLSFLREAIRRTGCQAGLHDIRLEALSDHTIIPRVDIVTARALAPLDKLLCYAEPFLARGAVGLFHKGQDLDAELTAATKYWRIKLVKHPSVTDSRSVILEVKEVIRVGRRPSGKRS